MSAKNIINTMTKVYNANTARLKNEREKQEIWLKKQRKKLGPQVTYAYGPIYSSIRFPL